MVCNLFRGARSLVCFWPLEFHRCPKCAGHGATLQFGPKYFGQTQ